MVVWGSFGRGLGRLVWRRTFFEIGEVFDFDLVGDVELVEDDGYFPRVGALISWLDERDE